MMEKEIREVLNFSKTAARNLMDNLSFWREESHRELSKIIDLYNTTVNKSINEMVEEICHLQIKLSETEKERDGLRESLGALKCDKRQHGFKVSQECYNQSKIETDDPDDPDEEGVQHSNISQTQQNELKQDSTNENAATFGIIGQVSHHHIPNEDATETMVERMDQDKVDEDSSPEIKRHACEECGDTFKEKRSLENHTLEIHIIGTRTRNYRPMTVYQNKMYHCKECGYSVSNKYSFNKHIKAVHEKIKDFKCDECSFASSEKGNLKRHKSKHHDFDWKKFIPEVSKEEIHISTRANISHTVKPIMK